MRLCIRLLTIAVPVALLPAQTLAQARAPIDCSILLCLAGGWPSAHECTVAKLEFMRRITPFPIEPPLQIWRCPLGASYNDQSPSERFWSIASAKVPQRSTSTDPNEGIRDLAIRISTGRGADIDVSDPVFDFVRSIKIYDIDWSQHYRSGSEYSDCVSRKGRVRIGTYGMQGDFSWADFNILDAPAWIGTGLRPMQSCPAAGTFRGVAVEWTDYFGGHDYEVIRY